jgi:hypothetical protein
MLHPGLYEQVINNALTGELAEIPEARKSVAPIDKAEASKVLAQYLADVVQKGLDNVLGQRRGYFCPDRADQPESLISFKIQRKKLTLPRWALTGGQSSFLRFCGRPIRGWRWEKLRRT